MTPSTKNPKPKILNFFILNSKTSWVFRRFEQLASSIAWQVVASQSFPWEGKSYLLKNYPTWDVTHIEPKPKLENNLLSELEDIPNPQKVWTAL